MSKQSNKNKDRLLGMPHGTANGRLRKMIIYDLARELGRLECFRCKEIIYKIDEFSIEHKVSWQSSQGPKASFFDISNIAFSHLSCNSATRTISNRKYKDPKESRRISDRKRYNDPQRREYMRKYRRDYYHRTKDLLA